MNNIVEILLRDPIMLSAVAVLAGTIIILIWAVNSLKTASAQNEDTSYEDMAAQEPPRNQQHDDNSGLNEARLQAIVNQLNDIGERLSGIEKTIKNAKPSEQTVPMLITPEKLEASFKRLESRIEALAAQPQSGGGASPDLSALETKLEGIHKLLIYLTDSGK